MNLARIGSEPESCQNGAAVVNRWRVKEWVWELAIARIDRFAASRGWRTATRMGSARAKPASRADIGAASCGFKHRGGVPRGNHAFSRKQFLLQNNRLAEDEPRRRA